MQGILVGSGGFIGSVLRYAMGGAVHRLLPFTTFPLGTFVVNALGCLAIGFLAGLAEARQLIGPGMRLFLYIGILGGFTTFSTFAAESFVLAETGRWVGAGIYVAANFLIGLLALVTAAMLVKGWMA